MTTMPNNQEVNALLEEIKEHLFNTHEIKASRFNEDEDEFLEWWNIDMSLTSIAIWEGCVVTISTYLNGDKVHARKFSGINELRSDYREEIADVVEIFV